MVSLCSIRVVKCLTLYRKRVDNLYIILKASTLLRLFELMITPTEIFFCVPTSHNIIISPSTRHHQSNHRDINRRYKDATASTSTNSATTSGCTFTVCCVFIYYRDFQFCNQRFNCKYTPLFMLQKKNITTIHNK